VLFEVMSSFGVVTDLRSRYQRNRSRSYFPGDEKIALIEGYWTRIAARNARFKLASNSPRGGVRDFKIQGGMCPSVGSLIRRYEAAGHHWEAISDHAYDTIRSQEEVPEMATNRRLAWLPGKRLPVERSPVRPKMAKLSERFVTDAGPKLVT